MFCTKSISKMFGNLLCFTALIVSAYAAGELNILTSPPSAIFKGHDHLKESLLLEVYTAALCFTTEQDSSWQGMFFRDPFRLAEAIVTIEVDGVANIGQVKGHRFPLKTDEDERDLYNAMVRRIEDHHPGDGNQLVRVELKEGQVAISVEQKNGVHMFEGIKDIEPTKTTGGALNLENDVHKNFLKEVSLMNAIADKVASAPPKSGYEPDIFWFKVVNLHAVCDFYGENSAEAKEAKDLLINAIDGLNEAFKAYYKGRVLVNVITSDASHTRRARRDTNENPENPDDKIDFDKLNLSKVYSSNYPVIFNIMLWFGVVMFFSLMAISLFIASMDPGRDSIIYRMTSTRMKKDN